MLDPRTDNVASGHKTKFVKRLQEHDGINPGDPEYRKPEDYIDFKKVYKFTTLNEYNVISVRIYKKNIV